MKIGLNKAIVAIGLCAMLLLFAGSARAEDAQQVAQELVSGLDIPADVAGTLVSGPGVTFGQRLSQALKNGGITQQQYDAIYNRFLQLPDERRWAIKNAFDQGQGIPIGKILNKPGDKASIKEHIADLKAQGFTGDQILNRLRNEGVSAQHLKDLGYGPAGEEQADEVSDLTQQWLDAGIPPEVVEDTITGPDDTLGQRLSGALSNGSLTQKQYDTLVASFLSLPDERRWAIKNAYDKGYAGKVWNQMTSAAHEYLNDDASIRDHIKDLRQQGYTREQIKNRLAAEGVNTQHLKDLGYAGHIRDVLKDDASLRDHVKDLKQQGYSREQIAQRLHNDGVSADKLRSLGFAAPAAGSIRGSHAKERPQGAKDVRDTRKDVRQGQDVRERRGREGAFTRGRDAGAGRGTAGRRR